MIGELQEGNGMRLDEWIGRKDAWTDFAPWWIALLGVSRDDEAMRTDDMRMIHDELDREGVDRILSIYQLILPYYVSILERTPPRRSMTNPLR